jgi:hypothetical protein
MARKLIYDGDKSISQIIRSPVSTQADLQKLCTRLGLKVKFDWIDNYDPHENNQILNIDEDHIGGTHWVAIYRNQYYFDPLGMPPARDELNTLQYTFVPIQNPKGGSCGLYCCLYLWYANMDEMDKFYSLFEIHRY